MKIEELQVSLVLQDYSAYRAVKEIIYSKESPSLVLDASHVRALKKMAEIIEATAEMEGVTLDQSLQDGLAMIRNASVGEAFGKEQAAFFNTEIILELGSTWGVTSNHEIHLEETMGATWGRYVELGGKGRLESVTVKLLDQSPLDHSDIQWVNSVRELGLLPNQSQAVTEAARALSPVSASRD